MNSWVMIKNGKTVTNSLILAEVFGKSHDNVLRDIRLQIEKLSDAGECEWGDLNFEECEYTNDSTGINRNRRYPKYELTEDAFALVAMSYITPKAMKMKVKFLNEFKRMRTLLNTRVPQTYKEALLALVEQVEHNEILEAEKLMLQQQVREYEPKATYVDQILRSTGSVAITQIAKDYGLSGQRLNRILHEEGVQYKLHGQWLLYAKHQDCGYTKSKTVEYVDGAGEPRVKMNTQWTQRGRLFVHEILAKRGIVPTIDRQQQLVNLDVSL